MTSSLSSTGTLRMEGYSLLLNLLPELNPFISSCVKNRHYLAFKGFRHAFVG